MADLYVFWTPRRDGSFPVLDLPPVGPIYFSFSFGEANCRQIARLFLKRLFSLFSLDFFFFFSSIPFRIRWMSSFFPSPSYYTARILRLISCFSEGEEKFNRNLSALAWLENVRHEFRMKFPYCDYNSCVSVHLIIGQELAILCLFVCSPIWEIGGRHPALTEIFRPPPVGTGRKDQVPLTDPPTPLPRPPVPLQRKNSLT